MDALQSAMGPSSLGLMGASKYTQYSPAPPHGDREVSGHTQHTDTAPSEHHADPKPPLTPHTGNRACSLRGTVESCFACLVRSDRGKALVSRVRYSLAVAQSERNGANHGNRRSRKLRFRGPNTVATHSKDIGDARARAHSYGVPRMFGPPNHIVLNRLCERTARSLPARVRAVHRGGHV